MEWINGSTNQDQNQRYISQIHLSIPQCGHYDLLTSVRVNETPANIKLQYKQAIIIDITKK